MSGVKNGIPAALADKVRKINSAVIHSQTPEERQAKRAERKRIRDASKRGQG